MDLKLIAFAVIASATVAAAQTTSGTELVEILQYRERGTGRNVVVPCVKSIGATTSNADVVTAGNRVNLGRIDPGQTKCFAFDANQSVGSPVYTIEIEPVR